jgi:hypothetical protein
MKDNIVLWTKTYHVDFERVKKLKESIEKYNKDNIRFYISCPLAEKQLLIDMIGSDGYIYIPDEQIHPPNPRLTGWMQQTPIKLHAYEQLNCNNVLILDSDCYFIKDFYETDFIAYDDVPYSIIHENKQVQEYNTIFFNKNMRNTEYHKAQKAYREVFGGKSNRVYDYGPNPHIMSAKVLDHMKEHYLEPNGYTFESFYFAMKEAYPGIHPRESLTYGEYLLAAKPIDIIPSGPLFKVYHWPEMVQFERDNNLFNQEQIKQNYFGILYQSKLASDHPETYIK